MFIVKCVSVQLAWSRGGNETDLGYVEYPVTGQVDFATLDDAISGVIPDDGTQQTPAQQAQAKLEAKLGQAETGQQDPAAGRQPAGARRPQPGVRPQR